MKNQYIQLVPADLSLAEQVVDYYNRNRDFLEAFEPIRSEDFFSLEYQRAIIKNEMAEFEEKKALNQIVQETLADESGTGIQVYIGDESPVQTMRDCSVVTATYELGEGMKGTVGIIGPKRMDYDKVVGILKNLMNQLDALYNKKT